MKKEVEKYRMAKEMLLNEVYPSTKSLKDKNDGFHGFSKNNFEHF